MSLKFACPKCYQTLVAEERKIGRKVQCPRCETSIVVPDQQGAAELLERKLAGRSTDESAGPRPPTNLSIEGGRAPAAARDAARAAKTGPPALPDPAKREKSPPAAEPVNGKGVPKRGATGTSVAASQTRGAESAASGSPKAVVGNFQDPHNPAANPVEAAIKTRPRAVSPATTGEMGRVSVARWVLFAQAALIALVAVVAFCSGLVIGGARPKADVAAPATPAARPVEIAGSVRFRPDAKTPYQPDSDAVVIALPSGAVAAEKIKVAGLRPQDPAPGENNSQTRIIESLDGGFARVDRAGQFRLTLRPGGYVVLAISKHAKRPKGQQIPAADAVLLGQFFTSGSDLLGGAKYALAEQVLSHDRPLEFEF